MDGGVGGVSSRSTGTPVKTANFPEVFEKFTGARSYSEWVFEYVASVPAVAPGSEGTKKAVIIPAK